MSSFIAYIDHPLAVQLATGLIGSEVTLSDQHGATAGVNFKVIFSATKNSTAATSTKTEQLLPEVLIDALREATPNLATTLDEVRGKMFGGSSGFRPGSPLIIREARLSAVEQHQPSDLILAGESCAMSILSSGSYSIRAYFSSAHEPSMRDLLGEPIEVLGLLRYTKPYHTEGAQAQNLGLRVVGVWLR